jgi:hypothetical protein
MALFKDGKPIYVMHRSMIEGRMPQQIAAELSKVVAEHCSRKGPSVPQEDFKKIVNAVACGSSIPRTGH